MTEVANNVSNDLHLAGLNTQQSDAVSHVDGPLLVLAGAGTGKTKVLTSRVAHILSQGSASPSQVLAVTFTNKAAKEMKERIRSFIGDTVDHMWIGTFHSIAAKILRYYGSRLAIESNFTIIDTTDQLKIAKQILKDWNIDEKQHTAKLMLYIIGRYKDKGWAPNKVPAGEQGDFANGKIIELYAEYQERLQRLNAVDFGDLLLYNIKLFNEHLDVCTYYQNKFKYLLVDEYQDTNVVQYLWLRLLVQSHSNICCVGDDDQAIYGWRGAEVSNILRFDNDFAGARVIRLERNYRSTCYILDAATQLIANNKSRHRKTLWTDEKYGEKIKLNNFFSDKQESKFVADEIDVLNRLHKEKLANIAILVRASYQTRSFEESLNSFRIPYRIVGGTKFYERLEIKDAVSYIRLLLNIEDSLALERIINVPKRGIGEATMQQIYLYSRDHQVSIFKAAQTLIDDKIIKGKVAKNISELFNNLLRWQALLLTQPHAEVIDLILNESGYRDMWKSQETEEAKERLDNLKELISSISEFSDLPSYLEHISLVSDADSIADDNKVNIMTIHAAKGLEFNSVFLPGWEEGIFPSGRAISEVGGKGLEEERRLAYVGITRARSKLYISYANNRYLYGGLQNSEPSRFIEELPEDSYEVIHDTGTYRQANAKAPPANFMPPREPTRSSIVNQYLSNNNKQSANYELKQSTTLRFQYGKRVSHIKFGDGTIIGVAEEMVQVMFDKAGFKKIAMDYLQVVE